MLAGKEHRLIRTIFREITLRDISVVEEAEGALQFAASLATETLAAIRSAENLLGTCEVQPEAVGCFVATRCNRFTGSESRANIITVAIGETFGKLAQAKIELVFGAHGLSESAPDPLANAPHELRMTPEPKAAIATKPGKSAPTK